MNHEYFFEILAEEIPAWMLPHPVLREKLVELYRRDIGAEPDDSTITIGATSRRIYFRLAGLPERLADKEEEVKGPPRKMAFDASGNPTPALAGFLKKNSASLDSVLPASDEYVRIKRTIAGRVMREILAERIPSIITELRWPKMMRWGAGESSYIRPIHSVVSIFDGTSLPVTIFGISSGTSTVGHRILAPAAIEVASYDDYIRKLEAAHVIASAERREEEMRRRCRDLAAEVGGTPREDATIWDQWRYLTECPGIVRSEFRNDFLALPEEVLITVMRVHQKQLPILLNGKLSGAFLAVIDNIGDPDGNAASGNAFVSNARFADAKFFYETDRRRKLIDRLDDLSHLQFHEKLGDYRTKTERIEQIVRDICTHLGIDGNDAILAARLAKTDLVTEMVKEFTELQGQIGGIYAREEGQPEQIWKAIYDHYLPAAVEGAMPRTRTGAIVSLADKIDTLAGFFSVGIKPSGSKDPFGLRRAGQGVVQLLLRTDQDRVEVPLSRLIDFALAAYGRSAVGETIKNDLLEFFADRVRTLLEMAPFSLAYDEISAAMESGWTESLTDLVDRAAAIRIVRNDPAFLSILDSAKRIANITAGSAAVSIDPGRLEHATEKRLYELAEAVGSQIEELSAERKYSSALESFAGLAPELETFFNDVMVMVDDERIRNNRIALLRKVGNSALRIADVTRIVVDRRDYRSER